MKILSQDDIERIEKALNDVDADPVRPEANIGERQRAGIHNVNLLAWISEAYGRRLVAEMRRLLALRNAVASLQSACENQRCPECRSTQMDRDVAIAIMTVAEVANER